MKFRILTAQSIRRWGRQSILVPLCMQTFLETNSGKCDERSSNNLMMLTFDRHPSTSQFVWKGVSFASPSLTVRHYSAVVPLEHILQKAKNVSEPIEARSNGLTNAKLCRQSHCLPALFGANQNPGNPLVLDILQFIFIKSFKHKELHFHIPAVLLGGLAPAYKLCYIEYLQLKWSES